MAIHAILSEAEQFAIVNALAFYNDFHATNLRIVEDDLEQWQLAYKEDNRGMNADGPVDQLATRIANLT